MAIMAFLVLGVLFVVLVLYFSASVQQAREADLPEAETTVQNQSSDAA